MGALFRFLESHYGANTAYEAVAGLLVLLALVSAGISLVLLKGKLPPIPRPGRQRTKAAGRSLAARAMLAAPRSGLLKTDPATEIMIGLAAACLVGWLAASRLNRARGGAGGK
jgi:cobalamin synthase